MQITTKQVLKILYVVAWIIFVGVSIEAGGFIFNSFYTMVINPVDAKHFWPATDLSSLYNYDHGYFLLITSLMSAVATMKACLFYLIIRILDGKKLDLAKPFNTEVGRFIFNMSYVAAVIGFLSWWGIKYAAWLITKGVAMPDVQALELGGADVWLFMGVTIFVIAQIFKRGIELQSENELIV